MLFRNITNWVDPERDRGLLFFAQRIDELTFEYTTESYRSPTMNPPSLVQESLDLAASAVRLGKTSDSISHVLDELEFKLRNNLVVSSLLSLNLTTHLNYDRSSIPDIVRKLRILQGEISEQSYALKSFELAFTYCQEDKKKSIDFIATEIVSSLITYGVSAKHINDCVKKHFFKDSIVDGASSLTPFFRDIFPHHHRFKVFFAIDTPIDGLDSGDLLDALGITFHKKIPDELKSAKDFDLLALNGDERYVTIKDVYAPDRFAAVSLAKGTLQLLHDLFALFHHKETYTIREEAFTLQACCDEEVNSVRTFTNPMQFTKDKKPAEALKELQRLVQSSHLVEGPDRDKFFRVSAFHGMTLQSDSIESQIVNIWTAMETMIPSRKSGSIIQSVVNGALPFTGLNYARKLFKTLTFDFLRWDRRLLTKALRKTDKPAGGDLVDHVFSLVVDNNNEETLDELFHSLKNFELLRYRTHILRSNFISPQRIIDTINSHQRKVEWQIHRIYRARNSIVHSGHTPANSGSLFLNAHDYFDQIFDTTNSLCGGSNGYANFTDAFNFASALFEQYVSNIRRMDAVKSASAKSILWQPPSPPSPHKWWTAST